LLLRQQLVVVVVVIVLAIVLLHCSDTRNFPSPFGIVRARAGQSAIRNPTGPKQMPDTFSGFVALALAPPPKCE